MKKIGIIGGMSYESSIHYYQRINDQVNDLAGGLTCAEMLFYNVNFGEIREYMITNQWDKIEKKLIEIACILEKAGADYIMIATNTMHKLADAIQNSISVPLIHIADSVANECKDNNIKRVGLIGTKYTMTEDFLIKRLEDNELEVFVPSDSRDINNIDRIIFDELCKGKILSNSKQCYIDIINKLIEENNIEGLILGCTEIEMLLKKEDVTVPLFDTTQAHINSATQCCLEKIKIMKR